MNIYEQQSTFNPNMPVRYLVYIGMLYNRYIETNKNFHKYSSVQQSLPTPRCVCFYNGTSNKEDKVILKLTDSFHSDLQSDVELSVTMLNINCGKNKELLSACKPLYEYSWFIDAIRSNGSSKEMIAEAVNAALAMMPDNFLIKPLLVANKAEVTNMFITEYNEEQARKDFFEEGRAEGEAKGKAEERNKTIQRIKALIAAGGNRDELVKLFEITPEECAAFSI